MVERCSRKLFLVVLAASLAAVSAGISAADDKKEPLPSHEAAEPAKLGIDIGGFRASATLQISTNNLKIMTLALHNYAGSYDNALPADVLDKDGKPLLSWRVRLLPFIEQQALYDQFKLNEPWDSKHNLALLEKMPKVFTSPRVTVKRKGYTVYQVFSGPGALFNSGKSKYNVANIPDGISNTLFAVENSKAVPWTKPADMPFDKDKKVSLDFGKPYGDKPLGATMDGSVRVLDLKKIKPETLKNAITPDDGNTLGKDWKQ